MELKKKIANSIFKKQTKKMGYVEFKNWMNSNNIHKELKTQIQKYYGGCGANGCGDPKCEYLELLTSCVYVELINKNESIKNN